MDRKIVEMLVSGAGVNLVGRTLHVGKARIRRLRQEAWERGYLSATGGRGVVPLPAPPEVIFPDPVDGRALQISVEHRELACHEEWIRDRLQTGWLAVTVFEELPAAVRAVVSRSSFYRYLERAKLNRIGETYRRVVPEIVHQPGEAVLLDWGKLRDVVDPATGRRRTLWVLAGVMGYSRQMVVRLVWSNDVATTLEAIASMLAELGGVPVKLTSDNPKCFALEASRYEPLLNPVFERFAAHYGFIIECLPPGDPEKKGKIERPIPYLRRLYQAHGEDWHGIEESQAYLSLKVALANERRHGTTQRQPCDVFAVEEAPRLKSLPATAYEIETYHEGTVRQDGHVRFANKYYSVDEVHIGEEAAIVGSRALVSIYRGGRLIEVHERLTDPNRSKSTKPHHLKPWERALEDHSVYRERAARLGPSVERMVVAIIKQGQGFIDTRKVWGILSLDKRYPADAIDAACRMAWEVGSIGFRGVVRLLEGGPRKPRLPAAAGDRRSRGGYRFVRPMSEYERQLPMFDEKEGHA